MFFIIFNKNWKSREAQYEGEVLRRLKKVISSKRISQAHETQKGCGEVGLVLFVGDDLENGIALFEIFDVIQIEFDDRLVFWLQ